MTVQQFRNIVMIIFIVALVEILVGAFYYFVFFVPSKQLEELAIQQQSEIELKKIEQERLLEEAKLEEETRMEEIRLEVKEIDLELARIERWEKEGKEYEELRQEEETLKGDGANLQSCMKIVVENYHNQWNSFCEQLLLPNTCSLPEEYSKEINDDYELGKAQCEDFFEN